MATVSLASTTEIGYLYDIGPSLAAASMHARMAPRRVWSGLVDLVPGAEDVVGCSAPSVLQGAADLRNGPQQLVNPLGLTRGDAAVMGSGGTQFITVELRTESGKATPEQLAFICDLQRDGGRAGIALSVDDAARIALD